MRKQSFTMLGCVAGLMLGVAASTVSAETLLMPKRDFQKAPTAEVVWGITTLANGTPYTLDYGDGSPLQVGVVADRSYIAFNHAFLCGVAQCTDTITLTVGGETATTQVNVFDQGSISASNLRDLNINRAIQDGLRFLWTSQSNRGNFDTTVSITWTRRESSRACCRRRRRLCRRRWRLWRRSACRRRCVRR